MIPEIDSVGAAIVKGVCNPEAKDLAIDLGDFELGALLNEGVLQEIPGIKIVIAVRKTWTAIHDQLFLRKVAGFLAACPRFTAAEKETFVREHLSDAKKAKNLGEAIVLILDKLDDLEKPEILAKFFAAFVRGEINLETFRRLAAATDIGFLEDLKTFAQISNFADERLKPLYSNLVRTGLVNLEGPNVPGEGGMAKIRYEVNGLGQLFKNYINKPSAQT
jgi:hypothetical protein